MTEPKDREDFEYSREQLEDMRRCSRNLQRVAAFMTEMFGEADGVALSARAAAALFMEQFHHNTLEDEREQIERMLINEDPLTPVGEEP